MDPVIFYFIGGLAAGVGGSFVAARLLGVDQYWNAPSQTSPEMVAHSLIQAARVYTLTGPSGLVSLTSNSDSPLLAAALKLVVEGHNPAMIRRYLQSKAVRVRSTTQRKHFIGLLLSQMAPILGIAGMAGAMYLGLSRLQDPTASASGFAVSLLLLMVGGNVIAMFGRRLTRPTTQILASIELSNALIIEAVPMIREGAAVDLIEGRLKELLNPASSFGPGEVAKAA